MYILTIPIKTIAHHRHASPPLPFPLSVCLRAHTCIYMCTRAYMSRPCLLSNTLHCLFLSVAAVSLFNPLPTDGYCWKAFGVSNGAATYSLHTDLFLLTPVLGGKFLERSWQSECMCDLAGCRQIPLQFPSRGAVPFCTPTCSVRKTAAPPGIHQ